MHTRSDAQEPLPVTFSSDMCERGPARLIQTNDYGPVLALNVSHNANGRCNRYSASYGRALAHASLQPTTSTITFLLICALFNRLGVLFLLFCSQPRRVQHRPINPGEFACTLKARLCAVEIVPNCNAAASPSPTARQGRTLGPSQHTPACSTAS
jgi:hypothetical protein